MKINANAVSRASCQVACGYSTKKPPIFYWILCIGDNLAALQCIQSRISTRAINQRQVAVEMIE